MLLSDIEHAHMSRMFKILWTGCVASLRLFCRDLDVIEELLVVVAVIVVCLAFIWLRKVLKVVAQLNHLSCWLEERASWCLLLVFDLTLLFFVARLRVASVRVGLV